MGWRALTAEWKARRAGRRHVADDIYRPARDVIGPTGWMWSNGWDAMQEGSEAYLRSFDPRVPHSMFISERDRTRSNIPIPLIERCIEDWSVTQPGEKVEGD